MKNKKNIGILGLGAIGSTLASFLIQQSEQPLFYYNRSPKSGIRIIQADQRIDIPVKVETSWEGKPKLDWLLVCLKEYHYDGAIEQLKTLISPATKIAVIRNGLRLMQPILKFTSPEYVLETQIDCPVQPVEEDFYEVLSAPVITAKKSAIADEFTSLFPSTGITINQVDDFTTASWIKLLESACLGAILCLSGETLWVIRKKELTKLYKQLLAEGIAVAKADGAQLSKKIIREMVYKTRLYPMTKGSSMLTDRLAGRPIEIGAKSGIIAKLGKQYQIETPLHDMVTSLLKYTNTKK